MSNDPIHVTGLTLVKNNWLAKRLRMGHPATMRQLVNRVRKDPKNLKSWRRMEKTFKSKD